MPSQQTAATILFWVQVLSGIAATIFIGQWMWKHAKGIGGGDVTSFPMKYPRLLLGLIAFSMLCGVVGLWLLFHLPKPVQPPPCPAVKECPAAAPSPVVPVPAVKKTPPPKAGSTTATQSGAGNQQTTIGGDVKQGGNGDCQQNLIGGNNNTNNCVPQLLTITDSQADKAGNALAGKHLSGSAQIDFDFTGEGVPELQTKIVKILDIAKIPNESNPVINSVNASATGWAPKYPGLSFANVCDANKGLADAIDSALKKAGITKESIKRVELPNAASPTLIINIRKP